MGFVLRLRTNFRFLLGAALAVTLAGSFHSARAQTKETASGIFALLKTNTTAHPIKNLSFRTCWNNPNIAGVVLRTDWATVEQAQDQFSWAFLDTGLSLAQSHNKKIIISIDAGNSSPSWIYSLGAAQFTLTTYGIMPCPWDSIFKYRWELFLTQFGNRYDSNPYLVCVTLTSPGRTVEYFFAQTTTDAKELQADVGVQGWIDAANYNTDSFVEALPTTPLFCATGVPVIWKGSVAMTSVINYGFTKYPGQFGIQSNELSALPFQNGIFPHTTLTAAGLSPMGFQMLQTVASGRLHGTLQQALANGISVGAHFIEVYDMDCEDPNQQSVIATANQQLLTAYP
jgi:hypothetical protein